MVSSIYKKKLTLSLNDILKIEVYNQDLKLFSFNDKDLVIEIVKDLNNINYITNKGKNRSNYSLIIYYLNNTVKISKHRSFIEDKFVTTNFSKEYEILIDKILKKAKASSFWTGFLIVENI